MNISLNPFPLLTTERLVLRKLNANDLDALHALRSDERVNRYIGRSSNVSAEQVSEFINKIAAIIENRQGVYWVICLKDKPNLIGTICFYNLDFERCLAEIGHELLPDYQRQGLMQEAVTAVINYGSGVMGLKVITAVSHPDNQSSGRLLTRNGFELDSEHKYISEEDADGLLAYALVK